ncbi:MAG: hypothetical protein R3B89_13095 [Polyangiaceae bacterium]
MTASRSRTSKRWLTAYLITSLCSGGAFAQNSPSAPGDGGEEHSADTAPDSQPDGDPSEQESLIERAIELRKQRNESAARELLQQAYREEKSPRVAGHLGLAERALGLAREAEGHLREALAASDDPWVTENEELLRGALRYAERQLAWARIVVRPSFVKAKVTIAGEPVDASRRVRVKAGSVVIEATAPGYSSSRVTTEIPPEKELLVTLNLRAQEAPEPTVGSNPEPRENDELAPPKDETHGPPVSAYWLLGGGALALGIGSYFGVRALSEKSTADDLCPTTRCTSAEGVSADEDARRFALYSDVGVGLGIVALGVATYLFLTDTNSRPRSGLRLRLAGRAGSASWTF